MTNYANIDRLTEHPSFTGTHDNTIAIDGTLKLIGSDKIDDWGNVDDVKNWDAEGGIASYGRYYFSGNLDLTTAKRVRLRKNLVAQVINSVDSFDDREYNIDDWADFDGISGNEANAKLYVRATDDDPADSPVWSDWELLDSAEYENRAFEFYLALTSSSPVHNIVISELGVNVDNIV